MTNVLEVKEQYITTVIIHNPLEPYTSRKVAKLIWDNDKTLYDYLYDLPDSVNWIIIYNGKEVTLEESKNIKPLPDTMLILSPMVTGGGRNSSGKQTLRQVTTLAIVAVATAVGFVYGGPAGAWAGSKAGMMIGGIYSTVSSLIWNRPDIKNNAADQFDETYGADGAKATAKEGIPVGLVYGEYRVAGNIIQNRTENVGDTQDLYLLQLLSEGEVESIDNILINEQPLNQFTNVETETRNGVDNQELIPWFDDTFVSEYKGTDITTAWSYMRTKNKLDKFSIDIIFPYGLYYQNMKVDGKTRKGGVNVDFEIQYKPITATDNDWRNINSTLKCYIRNVLYIEDGDKYIFIDENGVNRIYAFHNILYKEYDTVYEEGKLKEVYIYVQRGDNTEQTIKNFIEALQKDIDDGTTLVDAPGFRGTYEKYSSGLFNIFLEPIDFRHDYYTWDLKAEGFQSGDPQSLSTQSSNIVSIYGYSKNPIRRTISSNQIPLDYYDIRIRRVKEEMPAEVVDNKWTYTGYDKAQWQNLNEIILDDICYNHSAIMGVKVRLDGQLSSMPNITADVKGIKVNHYNYDDEITEKKWSNNPAWIALDVLTNGRYGGGLDISRIDVPKFIEWAEYCEENEISFNAYIGSESNLWDTLTSILMVGHAGLVICGTKISLSIDKPRDEVFMFNNSNIIKDSFSTSWSGLQDRANTFELTYYDAEDNYNQKTIKIVDSESMTNQNELKELKLTVIGITNEKQATRECKRLALKNKYLQQQVTFSAPVEAVGCSVGDVVIVQHDVPQWGYGGKLKSGSTTSRLFLDRTVTMKENRAYMVLVHHSAVCRAITEAQAVVSNSIFIAGSFQEKAKRLKSNGKDLEIIKIIPGSPLTEIKVSNANGINAGDTIELWDTDVLEEAPVITDAYRDIDVIELQQPMKYEPQAYCNWLFGYKDRYQKKFAITAMSGLNTETITLTGTEYSEASYDIDNYQGNDPIISDISTKMDPVYNLTASEELVKIGSAFSTNVTIDWDVSTLNTYFGADIYARPDSNSPFMKVGEVTNGLHSYTFENMNDGDEIEVKVVGFDGAGRRASFEESPIISYTVIGKDKKPATPINFTATKTTQGILLSWNPVVEVDLSGYIIKLGEEWINAEVIDSNIATNRYTVQYTEAGLKKFLLKSVDVFGNESETEAVATIMLEPPLDPVDFMSIQNNDFIVLKWNNLDSTVEKFRIKEGESWGSGTIVADVSGYSTTVPINGYYNRKFWIKSIDKFGVFCKNPVYTSPMAIEHQTKNVIVEYDESGNLFPNPNINMDLINDELVVRENAKYGEYVWYVDIGEKLYSRIISEDMVDAIQYSPKWKDFHNRWNSYEAQSPWIMKGSMDNVQIERQMALPGPIPDDIVEAFSFYNTPDGDVQGTKPVYNKTYHYSNGRFRDGIIVDDTSSLEYNINIPEIFSLYFWIRPRLLQSAGYLELVNQDGHFMRIRYYDSDKMYSLEDDQENKLTIKSEFLRNEPILMCITQSATERTLMIGFSKDLKVLRVSKELQPIGPIMYMGFR